MIFGVMYCFLLSAETWHSKYNVAYVWRTTWVCEKTLLSL